MPLLAVIFFLLIFTGIYSYLDYQGKIYLWMDNYYAKRRPVLPPFKKTASYQIGFITDAHGYRTIKYGNKLSPKVEEPLKAAVAHMNNVFKPDLVVQNGDFIEGTGKSFEGGTKDYLEMKKFYDQLEMPHYHVVGNHDLRPFDKEQWKKLNGLDSTYYYVEIGDLRIFVLDSNFVPGNSLEEEREVGPGVDYTRGYVSQEEIDWLKKVLAESYKFRKIVMIHHPPQESTFYKSNPSHFLRNGSQLREIFSQYKVQAVFSGHIEELYHEKIDGVDYYVLPGFWKSNEEKMSRLGDAEHAYKGAYAEITAGKKVTVKLFYYKKDQEQYFSRAIK